MWVGTTTALTVLANRVPPALLDRCLARTNVQAQQSSRLGPPADATNLREPVYGADVAAHGSSDRRPTSAPELWLSRHRRLVSGALAGAAVLGVQAARRR